MRQVTFVEPGRLEWQDVPAPRLEDSTDALVRPVAMATCDIDWAIVRGVAPLPGPFAFGHEFVAEVVQVGDEVNSVSVGALVVVPFQIACGSCRRCLAGLTGSCENFPRLASYGLAPFSREWGGALSDVVRVPCADHMLVTLPTGIDPVAVASLSDNIPDGWRTVGPY